MKLLLTSLVLFMSTADANESALEFSRWYVINDTVMGGVSQSRVDRDAEGAIVFSGTLSLENNGGFTSTRGDVIGANWRGYENVKLRVVGDGRSYLATIRLLGPTDRRVYYRQAFETETGAETEIVLPLSKFQPYAYGRRLRGVPKLTDQLHLIDTIGVMLADKKPGSFALQIMDVSLEGDPSSTEVAQTSTTVLQDFEVALYEGVPLFNNGRPDLCAKVYRETVQSVLAIDPSPLSAPAKATLEAALSAEQQDANAVDKAWTLRRAIDAVMMELAASR